MLLGSIGYRLPALRTANGRVPVRWTAITAAVAFAAMAVASSAEAKIVIGHSVDGIKLGDTQARVEKVLGHPSRCDPSCGVKATTWAYYEGFSGHITFNGTGRVQGMWTGSQSQKTAKGIHPGGPHTKGSSLADIKRAYPKAKCGEMANSGGFAWCDIYSRAHGRKVDTNFLIKAASYGVAEIAIGFA
jgi:hypothetical protein